MTTQTLTVTPLPDGAYVVMIDASGASLTLNLDNYNETTRRDNLTLGVFEIIGGDVVSTTPFIASQDEPLQQMYDFFDCFGATVKSGLEVTANGSNMSIDISAGELHFVGAGSQQAGNRRQNIIDVSGSVQKTFRTVLGRTGVILADGQVDIVPSLYDDGTTTPASVPPPNATTTVLRVYMLPEPNAELVVVLGQRTYSSLTEAISLDAEEEFILPGWMRGAVLRKRIAVTRDCTSLINENDSKLLGGSKFGVIPATGSSSTGGGGSATPYVPSASPFADEAARDAWAAANLTELFNNSSRYTQIAVGTSAERWGGDNQPSTYTPSSWFTTSAGTPHTEVDIPSWVGVAGEWTDIIVWPRLGSAIETDTWGADFIMWFTEPSSGTTFTQRVNANVLVGVDRTGLVDGADMLRIIGRVQTGNATSAEYRIIQDTADPKDVIRLQVKLAYNAAYEGLIINNLPINYPSGVSFGAFTDYAPTGNEVLITSVNTLDWDKRRIVDGSQGGVACSSVGEHSGEDAWIDFSGGTVDTYANDQKVIIASKEGTRFSAGEYRDWQRRSAQWFNGFAVDPQTLVINQGNSDEFTYLPVQCSGVSTSWINDTYSFAPWTSGIRANNANNSIVMTLTGGVVTQKLGVSFLISKAGSQNGTFEIRDENDVAVASLVIDGSTPIHPFIWFTYMMPDRITQSQHDAGSITFSLVRTDTNFAQEIFCLDTGFIVESVEPEQEANAVGQFDSNTRGIVPPRIVPIDRSGEDLDAGPIALDVLANNRPIWFNGDDWSYFNVTKFDIAIPQHTRQYSADIGTGDPIAQGWVYALAGPTKVTPVDGQYGYNRLLHIVDDTSSEPVGIRGSLDAATMGVMLANGWRWEFDCRVDAGDINHYLEVDSNYAGGQGRWIMSQGIDSSGQASLTFDGTTHLIGDADEVKHISVQCSEGSETARIYANGIYYGTLPKTSGASNSYLHHTSGSSGSTDEDAWLLNSTFFVMADSDKTKVLTAEDINNSIRSNTPNVINAVEVILPKQTFSIGQNFTLINGSEQNMTVRGEVGSNFIFNGRNECILPPYGKGEFTMTSFPRGVIWSVAGAVNPNQVKLTINGVSGAVIHQEGPYQGGITTRRTPGLPAGAWEVTPDDADGIVFTHSNCYMACTAINTAPTIATCQIVLGTPEVTTANAAGTRIDSDFTMELHW